MRAVVLVLVLAGGVWADAPKPAPLPPIPPIKPDPLAWKKTDPADHSAEPPTTDTKKLKEEIEKLTKARRDEAKPTPEPTPDERTRLRARLDELIEKLDKPKVEPKPAHPPDKGHDPKPTLPEGGKPADTVRSAANFYRIGETDQALQMLKVTDTSQLPKEERAFADYLRAACLRKLGKTTEALTIYRDVAAANDDPFLAEHAKLQVTAIRSAQELEAQLEQLRGKRKPK